MSPRYGPSFATARLVGLYKTQNEASAWGMWYEVGNVKTARIGPESVGE